MNKAELYQRFLDSKRQELERMASVTENAIKDVVAAPGRMETRYDSSKTENGYLADGLNLRQGDIERGLAELAMFELPEQPSRITEGAVVHLMIEDGKTTTGYYFILPYGGGSRLESDKGEVLVITPESPLFKAMHNRRVGEGFSVPGKHRKYTVLGIE